jgi:signal transduction histidine kinase
VSDTGHGIAKADINNIFDPFYAKSRQGKGIGLGLPLSYAIVKQHAGSIAVESAEGKGTTLSIKLPLATDE